MLEFNTLRIDPGAGCPVVEYRIDNDCVESRILDTSAGDSDRVERQWRALTPEQLSSHLMSGTVVAHWLRRRMGFHRLIRACTSSANNN